MACENTKADPNASLRSMSAPLIVTEKKEAANVKKNNCSPPVFPPDLPPDYSELFATSISTEICRRNFSTILKIYWVENSEYLLPETKMFCRETKMFCRETVSGLSGLIVRLFVYLKPQKIIEKQCMIKTKIAGEKEKIDSSKKSHRLKNFASTHHTHHTDQQKNVPQSFRKDSGRRPRLLPKLGREWRYFQHPQSRLGVLQGKGFRSSSDTCLPLGNLRIDHYPRGTARRLRHGERGK